MKSTTQICCTVLIASLEALDKARGDVSRSRFLSRLIQKSFPAEAQTSVENKKDASGRATNSAAPEVVSEEAEKQSTNEPPKEAAEL